MYQKERMRNLKGQKREDQQSLSSVPARPNSKKEMDNEKKRKIIV